MKTIQKNVLFTWLSIALFLISPQLNAQKYITAAGVRIGNQQLGLTVKQRLAKKISVEGIFNSNFSFKNASMSVLLERHQGLRRLNIYYGVGYRQLWHREEDPTKSAGIDAIIGIEFTLLGLNLSADFKPTIVNLATNKWFQTQVGFSIRYVIIKDKRRWFKRKKRKGGLFRR